jgi:hypothetical protein
VKNIEMARRGSSPESIVLDDFRHKYPGYALDIITTIGLKII